MKCEIDNCDLTIHTNIPTTLCVVHRYEQSQKEASIDQAIAEIDKRMGEWDFVPADWTPASRSAAKRFDAWMTK